MTGMEMIERVARAMGATLIPGSATVTAEYVISAELIRRLAGAAIGALRNDTVQHNPAATGSMPNET